jgi:LAO/AO transport system kinase
LIENEDPQGLDALESLYRFTGNAHVVGITGPPGSGKSSLIASLVQCIRQTDRQVAVLAVDPSSPLTGGAVLGDRVRMMDHHADPGVFVRSMASRGRQGGLAWATAELVHLLDAAGFPVILVETVGTGQDGVDIAALAQTTIVVEAPGLGDGVQAIKSGLLEVADIVVVNKSDQSGAEEARRVLRTTLDLARSPQRPRTPVLATCATQSEGIAELECAITSHLSWLNESGELARRRARALETEVLVALRSSLQRILLENSARSSRFVESIDRVVRGDITPRRAALLLSDQLVAN